MNTKFRLNKLEVDEFDTSDFEYIAIPNKKNPDFTIVTWFEKGESLSKNYETSDVEYYFKEEIWIKI